MSIENPNTGLSPGARGMAERYVDTMIRTESLIARGLYWIAVFLTLLMVGWAGLIVNQTLNTGNWRDGMLYTAICLGIAALFYFLGWGWRWLWSGRADHLFGRKKYAAPGRLESARQKVAAVFSSVP